MFLVLCTTENGQENKPNWKKLGKLLGSLEKKWRSMSPPCKLERLISASSEAPDFMENLKAFVLPETLRVIIQLSQDFSENKLLQIFEEISNRSLSPTKSRRKIANDNLNGERMVSEPVEMPNVTAAGLDAWNRSLSRQFYGDSQHQIIDI